MRILEKEAHGVPVIQGLRFGEGSSGEGRGFSIDFLNVVMKDFVLSIFKGLKDFQRKDIVLYHMYRGIYI